MQGKKRLLIAGAFLTIFTACLSHLSAGATIRIAADSDVGEGGKWTKARTTEWDVDVGFGHIPLVTLARGMLGLDEGHDGVPVESSTAIENVKV